MIVSLDDERLVYSGRIDRSDAKRPEFIFPATSLQFRFYGKKAVLTVENRGGAGWKYYAGVIADGAQSSRELLQNGVVRLVLVDEEEEKEHEILFFKRQDSCHEMALVSLELPDEGRLLAPPEKPELKIEVYGDSVSVGEVSEASDYAGKEDPQHFGEYTNSWYSYGWMAARKLHAQIHLIAKSGIALMDGTGYYHEPDSIGMETVWDKVHFEPQSEMACGRDRMQKDLWDFSQYTPQAVIVAIGQNDSYPHDYMKEDETCKRAVLWRSRYRMFLESLREKYPEAYIVCCTTLLIHDLSWDRSIASVCREMKDDKITYYRFRRTGKGTPGHLRIPEAEEMAEELAAYVKSLGILSV